MFGPVPSPGSHRQPQLISERHQRIEPARRLFGAGHLALTMRPHPAATSAETYWARHERKSRSIVARVTYDVWRLGLLREDFRTCSCARCSARGSLQPINGKFVVRGTLECTPDVVLYVVVGGVIHEFVEQIRQRLRSQHVGFRDKVCQGRPRPRWWRRRCRVLGRRRGRRGPGVSWPAGIGEGAGVAEGEVGGELAG